jgi:hypothetical protein
MRSNKRARRWGSFLWRAPRQRAEHPMIESSRQLVYGVRDITIQSRT